MTQIPLTSLTCPLDHLPLTRQGKCFTCPSGHSFDLAKRGYINLLPPQNKRSKDPGDSIEMIAARQRFLAAGHYQALANALADVSAVSESVTLLDAGCGEGYYLRQLERSAPLTHWLAAGLDISKPAIDTAAKLDKGFQYLVASNANIPLAKDSVDVLWCVFGFADFAQFSHVLKPSGRLIMVDPGPEHLRELREIIYTDVVEKDTERTTPAGYDLADTLNIKGSMNLDNASINDLLLMTPHLFRAKREGREKASQLQHLTCQYDMQLRVLLPQ